MSSLNFLIRAIAFYLPQYHPIPENDEWWGKGFTEWTNVTKAKPLFKGHYQPHLPADLGFYDLRLPEARQAQADLAQEYGIHGFCYYHYWFNGKRLLERPFNEVLHSGKPDFPFCLCWANENWSRRWDGQDQEVLMKQSYSEEDDLSHFQWLAKAFKDSRYIRVDGRPLFLIYRANHLPNPKKTAQIWRDEAVRLGVGELFLCRVESFPDERNNPADIGFDAAVEFQPDWSGGYLGKPLQQGRWWDRLRRLRLAEKSYSSNQIFSYPQIIENMINKPDVPYLRFPSVTPSWDNSARRKQWATILRDSTPEYYEYWLRSVIERVKDQPNQKGIIFINAWNEWAEGNHLEPCQRWERSYLEATIRALNYEKL